jgi:glyoxylase-like metal-dependent hydrolase (beta-lactamase superfamily II)
LLLQTKLKTSHHPFRPIEQFLAEIHTLVLGQLQTNCYIIQEGSEAIIVDAADEADRIIRFLKSIKARPIIILTTHAHFDHVLGVEELKHKTGIRFLIHHDDLPILESMQERVLTFMGQRSPPPPKPDGFMKEGDVFKVGNETLSVLNTPGHSPGSISLKGKGYVMTGDALFNQSIGRTDTPGGNLRLLVDSIKTKLFSLSDDTVVYPGHGAETTIGDEKLANPFVGQSARVY